MQQIAVLRAEIEKYCQSSRGDFCGTAIKVSRSVKGMKSGKAVGLDDMTGSVQERERRGICMVPD